MKKYNDTVRDYVRRLNDDDIKFLSSRLSNRLGGDLGEAFDLIQCNQDMDRWLSSADNADDFFDMVDIIDNQIQQEVKRRFSHEPKEQTTKASTATKR